MATSARLLAVKGERARVIRKVFVARVRFQVRFMYSDVVSSVQIGRAHV